MSQTHWFCPRCKKELVLAPQQERMCPHCRDPLVPMPPSATPPVPPPPGPPPVPPTTVPPSIPPWPTASGNPRPGSIPVPPTTLPPPLPSLQTAAGIPQPSATSVRPGAGWLPPPPPPVAPVQAANLPPVGSSGAPPLPIQTPHRSAQPPLAKNPNNGTVWWVVGIVLLISVLGSATVGILWLIGVLSSVTILGSATVPDSATVAYSHNYATDGSPKHSPTASTSYTPSDDQARVSPPNSAIPLSSPPNSSNEKRGSGNNVVPLGKNESDNDKKLDKNDKKAEKEQPRHPVLPDDPSDVPQLLKVLQEGEGADRLKAARLLGQQGERASWTVPYLVRVIETTEPPLAQEVYNALIAIGPPEPAQLHLLKHCLQSPRSLLRSYAIRMYALGTPPLPADTLPVAMQLFPQAGADEKLELLQAFERAGSVAVPHALGMVLDCLADPQARLRETAGRLLDKTWQVYTMPPPTAKPIAIERLRHPDARVREEAAKILLNFARDKDAPAIWRELLSDTDVRVRRLAVRVCIDSAFDDNFRKETTPALIPLLHDPDPQIRRQIAIFLRTANQADNLVQQSVLKQFRAEQDPEVVVELSHTLAQITRSETGNLGLFRELLRYPHAPTRLEAARHLKELGNAAAEAIPDLIARARDQKEDLGVRRAALQALGAIGARAAAATLPIIEEMFQSYRLPPPNAGNTSSPEQPSSQDALLIAAVQSLRAFGHKGRELLEVQCRNTNLSNTVRAVIFRELLALGDPIPEVLVELIRFVEVYTELRPAAAETVPKNPHESVIDELLTATLRWKPPSRTGGKQDIPFPHSYRLWAILALSKLNLSVLSPVQRERVIKRLTYLAKEDSSSEINAEAKVAMERLRIPLR